MATRKARAPGIRGDAAYMVFEALLRAGKEPGKDFSYQPRVGGRRIGIELEVDFMFRDPPDLAMQVQDSLYVHRSGVETRGTDLVTKISLAGMGITLIILEHEKLIQNPDWLVSEALQYRDHSWG